MRGLRYWRGMHMRLIGSIFIGVFAAQLARAFALASITVIRDDLRWCRWRNPVELLQRILKCMTGFW